MNNDRNKCIITNNANTQHGPRRPNGIDDIIAAQIAARKVDVAQPLKPINPRNICRIPGMNDHLFN